MLFPFPNLKTNCLVCSASCGARWKGYYVRQVIYYDYIGLVAIHVGHCYKTKSDFSYLPDFLIPGRRLSRPMFECYLKTFHRTRNVKTSIDELVMSVPEASDFTVALSTAYNWIYQAVRALRINANRFAILAPIKTSVSVFHNLGGSIVIELFLIESLWHPTYQIIQPP